MPMPNNRSSRKRNRAEKAAPESAAMTPAPIPTPTYRGVLLPDDPAQWDREALRTDHAAIARATMEMLVERFEQEPEYGWLDLKVDAATGLEFDRDDPIRGRNAVYAWIQGRGLEAIAGHGAWLASLGDADSEALATRLRYVAETVLARLRLVRRQNGGHLFFFLAPGGRPFRINIRGQREPVTLDADSPHNFSDMFGSKGMLAAAAWLGDSEARTEAEAYLESVARAVLAGRFVTDQQPLDPRNPVAPVAGRLLLGPPMILIGGMAMWVEAGGGTRAARLGLDLVRRVLDRHVETREVHRIIEHHDIWEFSTPDGRPWREAGRIPSDPGHALEFVGLTARLVRAIRAGGVASAATPGELERIEAMLAPMLLRNFRNGFRPGPGGIVKLFDLVNRRDMNDEMPWWSLPETMRAALACAAGTADPEVRADCLDVFRLCHNTFVEHYVQPGPGLLAVQTRTADGQVSQSIPATADADPGYHTGLSLLDGMRILEEVVLDSKAGTAGEETETIPGLEPVFTRAPEIEAMDPGPLPVSVSSWLRSQRTDETWASEARELLWRLVEVDTTPKPTARACAAAEAAAFQLIESALRRSVSGLRVRRAAIRPAIADHPYFSLPYYIPLPALKGRALARKAYAGRSNLVVQLGRAATPSPRLVWNAHVDCVPPHLPWRGEGNTVHGRGTADDKSACVAMVAAARLLEGVAERFGLRPACSVELQFVIDEETGGNGSLSVASDPKSPAPDAVIVLECTGNRIHPANRGAVWYMARITAGATVTAAQVVEAAAFVIGGLEREGRRIRSESEHPLFPDRPVTTCHGRIGPFGQHPSRVHDLVPLRVHWAGLPAGQVIRAVEDAVAAYCAEYGDKTVEGAGDGVLERHIGWSDCGPESARLEVYGLAGHMGAAARLDGAITKAAYIVHRLVNLRGERGGEWGHLSLELDSPAENPLVLEGGQGFLPTHNLDAVCERMRRAADRGLAEYRRTAHLDPDALAVTVGFDKLHNAAYESRADGPALDGLAEAARAAGIDEDMQVTGWKASCDARIFAREYPDAEVLTFGPGKLSLAHSGNEHAELADILAAAEALARMALAYGREE